jgi:ATP-binding cassette, subfamily B, bacterial
MPSGARRLGKRKMSIAHPTQALGPVRPERWPASIVLALVAFYRWNRLMYRWAWVVVRPAFAIFMLAALGELLIGLGRQYQTALISSVVGRLGSAAGALAGHGVLGGAQPSNWLDQIIPHELSETAFLLLAVVVLMALVQFGFRAADGLANSRMTAILQSKLHDRLISFGNLWYDRPGHDTGGNIQIINLAPMVQQSLALVVKSPLIQGITAITAFALIFQGVAQLPHTPLWVYVVGVTLLLVLPVVAWLLSQPVRRANESVVATQKAVSTQLLNSLSQPLAIQALGGERQRAARVREWLQALAWARFRTAWRSDAAGEFKGALPTLLQALFLLYAVFASIRLGSSSAASLGGSLQAIVLIGGLVPEAVWSMISIIDIFAGTNEQWPMISNVGEVLDMAPPAEAAKATNWPKDAKDIHLCNVGLSYGPLLPVVLDGIDCEFVPGVITAIAGAAGSGKSTIFQLLTRLRRPTAGTITISETGLDSIRIDEVRRHIGIVHQSPPFLTDTVRANFQLASIDATDAEIEAACRTVGVWEVLVAKNPAAPLDQPMTRDSGGANDFSGGERRGLAIARGLLNRPSILLFDEPTAGIDAPTLERVAAAIKRASVGITSIVIDHNLDFVLGVADRVCVLSGGRFVQSGDPRQLAAQPGPFRELLEAVRRLAGDTTMTVTSYPMPAYGPFAASGDTSSPPMPTGQRTSAVVIVRGTEIEPDEAQGPG